jgi:hypothetical protein
MWKYYRLGLRKFDGCQSFLNAIINLRLINIHIRTYCLFHKKLKWDTEIDIRQQFL